MAALLQQPLPVSKNRRRIFESVFSPSASSSTLHSTPQSSQTPVPTHGYNTRHHPHPAPSPADLSQSAVSLLPSPAAIFAKGTRAWHLATTYLSFPNSAFPKSDVEWINQQNPPGRDVVEAIKYLMSNADDVHEGLKGENLLEWYVCEVRRHFLAWVRPEIEIPAEYDNAPELLGEILGRLTVSQNIYLYVLRSYLLPEPEKKQQRRRSKRNLNAVREQEEAEAGEDLRVQNFIRSLNSVISYSLPDPAWSRLVYEVFLEVCGVAMGLSTGKEEIDEEDTMIDDDDDGTEAATDLAMEDDLLTYQGVGLSQQSFASITDIDGDIIVDSDGEQLENPQAMDGIEEFEDFKKKEIEKIARKENEQEQRRKEKEDAPKREARAKVLEIWGALERLGMGGGGRRGERVFAEVVNTLMTTYIYQCFAGSWASPSKVSDELEYWIENVLGNLVIEILFSTKTTANVDWLARLKKLSPRESFRVTRHSLDNRQKRGMDVDGGAALGEEEVKRRKEDLETWKQISVGRLGRLRVGELFDIVVHWPESLGGVEDLKSYIATPQTRLHLTTTFTTALSSRLLHPAAATSDILRAYVSLIRAFTVLDPRGVLLDRVSRGIRRYLRDRDDTVRVIVRGIMSDSPSDSAENEELSELSEELVKGIPALVAQQGGGLEELDFDDMNWVPDPVDAGPEFKRSKGLDVVGSLVSLYENKEVWVKEVQSVLSARLLTSKEWLFEKEIRTVELLKLRFGEPAMQSCDVMLKDITDSKRSDAHIREEAERFFTSAPEFHTKILSRLFWPAIKEDSGSFKLPPPIETLREKYENGFEDLKKKRKLTWLQSVGTVEVELELDDRVVIIDDATPAQAAVIYAFDEEQADGEGREGVEGGAEVTRSVRQLSQSLEMDENLVRKVLQYWGTKEVLKETSTKETWAVIENLEEYNNPNNPKNTHTTSNHQSTSNTDHHQQNQSHDDNDDDDEEFSEEKRKERAVVEQFVVGMLTNGGSMPEQRIAMMLGMVVPGGFSWSSEVLREFLMGLKSEGRVDFEGGCWKVAK